MKRISITEREIKDGRSPAGGFKRSTLAEWGVPWPPPKGWKKTIIQFGIPYQHKKNDHKHRNVSANRHGSKRKAENARSGMENREAPPAPSEAETRNKILCRKVSEWVDAHSWQISAKSANELRFIIGEDLEPDPETDGMAPWD